MDSFGDENLSITTKNSTVILSNNSDEVVYFMLLESETAALVDLAPDAEWPSIEAGTKKSIPYNEITGYTESSDEAFIMWGIGKQSSGNSQTFKL